MAEFSKVGTGFTEYNLVGLMDMYPGVSTL